MLAVLAPGQGSQKPGFLSPWLELPGTEELLNEWSALCDLDLVHLGTKADQAEITDTARTQPLLVAAALLAAAQLPMSEVDIVAGHSVGELSASHLAGVLTPEAAVSLAAVRGREMAAACAVTPTGMAAVLGGDETEVLAAIDAAGAFPANLNGAGQIVAAGSTESIDKLAASPPNKARVRPLSVAGAFHTPYMEPAREALSRTASGIEAKPASRTWLSNLDGRPMPDGPAAVQRLITQVTAPVRWNACMTELANAGVTAVVELPPAGTLAGLVKRELKGIEIIKVNTPDDLAAATDLIHRHRQEGNA